MKIFNPLKLAKKRLAELKLNLVQLYTPAGGLDDSNEINKIVQEKKINDVELIISEESMAQGAEFINKHQGNQYSTIKVGFYVIYGSAFPAWPLIELMLRNNKVKFEVVIIASPDIMRGEENMLEQLNLVIDHFSENDGVVVRSAYDYSTGEYKDCSCDLDYACIINPYETMTTEVCRSEYLLSKNVRTFFIHYTYSVSKFDLDLYCQNHFKNFWRVYLSSAITRHEIELNGGVTDNVKVVGYPKLDTVNYKSNSEDGRIKKIIIAPHHTFGYKHINIGAFKKFSKAYLELPKRYPHVNFVFRPHPLWKINLKEALGWTNEEINTFIDELMANPNVSYSTEFNYIELFNDSDALIHDCGSFVVEYLHTSKPCCFMMNDVGVYRNFNSMGKMGLDAHYQAMNVQDVFDFIDDVVLNQCDEMQVDREKMIKNYLLFNGQKASNLIIDDIVSTHFNSPDSFGLTINKSGLL